MTVDRLTRADALALVKAQEDALNARSEGNLFGSGTWLRHFIQEVGRDDWTYLVSRDEGRLVMPLYAQPDRPGDFRALANYYTSCYAMFPQGLTQAQHEAVIVERCRSQPAIDSIDLSPLSEAEAQTAVRAFGHAGWHTRQYHCFGNWFMPCEGLSFESYMARRPSQLLNTWQRKAKRFRPDRGECRLEMVTRPEDVSRAMAAYTQVYQKSWKQQEPYPHFVGNWAHHCAERGWLRMGLAWAGDVPIAAQFWFTFGQRAYIFKLAYDEEFSKHSAGTVLSAFMFQHSLDVDKVVEVDYLTGDDAYKQSWVTERRVRVGVLACNPRTWRGARRAVIEAMAAASQPLRARLSALTSRVAA